MRDARLIRAWSAALLLAAGTAASPAPTAAGVRVALLPASQSVAPGAEFEVSIEVTEAGSAFNAFDATVGYDPGALTLIALTPLSLQEGEAFTSACASRYHMFKAGADRDTITDVLLCSATSVAGPGRIYRLRFRASETPQVTQVRFLPGLRFYNEGLYVNPVTSSDATIGIGIAAGVGDSPRSRRLQASPNPSSRSGITFTVVTDRQETQRLVVCDLQGRIVRHLERGGFPAGVRTVRWDGRNDSGVAVPPGMYLGSLRAGGLVLTTRFMLLN